MQSKNLFLKMLTDLKEKKQLGYKAFNSKDILEILKFYSLLPSQSEALKEEINDWEINIQIFLTNEGTTYWLIIKDGEITWWGEEGI